MKYSVCRCQIPTLFLALLLAGCGQSPADESSQPPAENAGDSPTERPYDPESLANAKADLLTHLIEAERRVTRAKDKATDIPALFDTQKRSITGRLAEISQRIESLYQPARRLTIPGPSGDLQHFHGQIRSLDERRQAALAELESLTQTLANQARYRQALDSFLEEDQAEPSFIRVPLAFQPEAWGMTLTKAAGLAIETGDFSAAGTIFEFGDGWLERVEQHTALERQLAHDKIASLAERAEAAIADDRLTTPPGDNAAELLQRARRLDPEHPAIARLYGQVVDRYASLSRSALERGNYRAARSYVARVRSLPIPQDQIDRFSETSRQAEELARRESLSGRLEAAVEAGRRGELEELRTQITELREQAPDDPRLEQIEARYRVMLHLPGRVFSQQLGTNDSGEALRMIVGPRGTFVMGAKQPRFSLFGRSHKDEGPRHDVDIRYPYAVSQTEVTVDQFRAFVEASGYTTDAERSGFSEVFTSAGRTRVVNRNWRHDWLGRKAEGNHPVVHVSWDDAQAFVSWLSQRSGERFRLPSEAEFEVLARSNLEGDFAWNEDSGPEPFSGNFFGGADKPPREWGEKGETEDELSAYEDGAFGPTQVARYPANDFGFNDLIGNVAEWTQDCAHEDHSDSPANGRPREASGECRQRVIRGGSWISGYESLRLSHRRLSDKTTHDSATGFRVAMDFSN